MRTGWVVLLAGLLACASALAQYRWVDPAGQTSYGDNPPPGARDLRRVDSRSTDNAATSAALPFELRRAMEQYPVTLYTSDGCPPCDNARAFLRQRGVPFAERVAEGAEDGAELKRQTGHEKVPVLALGRQMEPGFEPQTWSRALDAARYPAASMLPAGFKPEAPKPLLARAGTTATTATEAAEAAAVPAAR